MRNYSETILSADTGRQTIENEPDIIILGGGIAGLSIAHHLNAAGVDSFSVYEAQAQVGGLARSFRWHGIDCDLAPHRLFSENKAVLGELLELVECNKISRQSQIVLQGKRIKDPINILELLKVNFPFHSARLVFSYLAAKMTPGRALNNFDDFVKNAYGNALNSLFFKPYAEKLLGIPSQNISAAWGARKLRVSGLKEVLKKNSKLYFDYFYYPKTEGYGAFAGKLGEQLAAHTQTQYLVEKVIYHPAERLYECHFQNERGDTVIKKSPVLVSTLPITTLLGFFGHPVPLCYRKMRLVYLHVDRPKVMDQQWVYFIDQDIVFNRVSEFKNFYPDHPQKNTTVLCAEITSDPDCATATVVDELVNLGMLNASDALDSKVIDIPNAYPVYDTHYEQNMTSANAILEQYPNLITLGRQAEFIHQDIDEIFGSARQAAEKCMAAVNGS